MEGISTGIKLVYPTFGVWTERARRSRRVGRLLIAEQGKMYRKRNRMGI